MAIILGIQDSHYSSACILKDGKILAAVSEERLVRIKNYSKFPKNAILKVLKITGIKGEDIDLVTFGEKSDRFDTLKHQKKDNRFSAKFLSAASNLVPLNFLGSRIATKLYINLATRNRIKKSLKEYKKFFEEINISLNKIVFYDHHECHAAVTYYMKPWNDKTLIFTCDGGGDGLCATIYTGEKNKIIKQDEISIVHSIGSMYSRVTSYLGMTPWEHEYKVMGLAPYTNPKYGETSYNIFKDFIKINGLKFYNKTGKVGPGFINHLHKKLKFIRFDNVAYGIQKLTENILSEWVNRNIHHYDIKKIALSGGVFLNVKANKVIGELENIDDMFIFPPAGDDCVSIGSAILGYIYLTKKDGKNPKIKPLTDLYFGPDYENQHDNFIKKINKKKYKVEYYKDINGYTGELIAKGETISRCSGRMEFGPRALGNRSILTDPRNLNSVNEINYAIKKRDFWMPFTPSILINRSDDYIINPKNFKAYYMVQAFDTTDKRKEIIAAIHQGDFTTRPQLLLKEHNPDYYELIKSYESETGVGAVLNTSFNLHGYPMVCSPEDAFYTLENSGLNYLVLGKYMIIKK